MGRRNKRCANEEGTQESWKTITAIATVGRFLLELYQAVRSGLVDAVRDFLKNLFNG
ncbi:hypothetical protein [Planobispora rosea]|uniref:hypothetical protein n=1 Tax=Planobispora rosea TaxID=35762 RepID=UPI00159F10E6|nr:hypothetical protein [Planobispora rosea]